MSWNRFVNVYNHLPSPPKFGSSERKHPIIEVKYSQFLMTVSFVDVLIIEVYFIIEAPETTEGPTEVYGIQEESSTKSQGEIIAFYVVVPLFCFCYGGSCVAYALHKLYKSCKKKRRQKQRINDEFESDTRPFMGSTIGTTRSRPLTACDIKVGRDIPSYIITPANQLPQKVLPERTQTPVYAFTIDDTDPAAPPKPVVAMMPDNPPPYSPPCNSFSLLPPDSNMEIDFTKLSIQDIIQIKMIMGQSRSTKPKKIISS